MAVTIVPLGINTSSGFKVIRDADCDATAEKNVNDGGATLYSIDIDNSANAAASFFKVYNTANPTVGTTDPDIVIKVPASTRREFVFIGGLSVSTSLSVACVTTGGTGGTTNPTSNVIVNMVIV